eukprot:TRINITY_DN67818_c6_g1_i4.p1 TRINITY_DN67818_c6_g1~~TRINITY_DN67818_c6_g1_i4.p1  ORF type:complete len:473 (+),score=78.31 TRINITY_DN67818_c6_g1_i4:139-1557(+)
MHCVSLSAAPVLLLLRCFFFFSCFIASPLCWCSSSSPPPSNFPSTVPELPSIAKPFVGCPVHSQCERKADDTHYCAVLREDNQYEYYRNKYAAFMSSPVQFWNWCDLIARDCNEGCWRIVPCPSSSSSSSAPQQTGDTTVATALVSSGHQLAAAVSTAAGLSTKSSQLQSVGAFPSTVPELPAIAKPFVGCPVHSQCERKADDTHYCAVLREDNRYEYYRNKYAAFVDSPVQFWNWCDLIARDCNEGCWRIVPCPSSANSGSTSSSAIAQSHQLPTNHQTTAGNTKVAVQEGAGTTCELEQDIFGQYTGMFRNSWEDFLFPHNRLDILDGDCSQEVCVSFSPIYKDGSEGSLLLGQTRILSEAMNDHKAKRINLAIVTPGACPSLSSSTSSSSAPDQAREKNKLHFRANGVRSGSKHNTQVVEGTRSGSSSFLVIGFLVVCALCVVLVAAVAVLALEIRARGVYRTQGPTLV